MTTDPQSCLDVELNSGSIHFPCGYCAVDVSDLDPAVERDECGHWYYIQSQSIGLGTYDDWAATDLSFSWTCSKYPIKTFRV